MFSFQNTVCNEKRWDEIMKRTWDKNKKKMLKEKSKKPTGKSREEEREK